VARGQCDPAVGWEGFVAALWEQLAAGFDLASEGFDGYGAVDAWFDHPDDAPVVVWGSDGDQPT
jgi:hypothetical protein